ncbi:DUF3068 domain-containing protein [Labedaea rhizosphaerae]|uniref:DUF3068 family protein n=1 Tax=Labedaea rhizosphaerae TaxID=598644 RepID=A0A4R6SK48_LABRH|nr:DUF3068 domain-containing protein [Labedaea rhizosphaerae]TDQ04478.1 DUF3068 family protein [Labedaea rhizosphaerae]
MRRALGFVLIGLGVFAIALGLLLRLYAYPRLAKIPLDEKTTSVSTGIASDVLIVLDEGKDVRVHHNVPLTSTMLVEGNLLTPDAKPDGNIAVWREKAQVVDDMGHIVDASIRQVCLDRTTSQGVQNCSRGQQYITNKQDSHGRDIVQLTSQVGQNFKFPFGVEQQSYQFYDTTLRKATEAKFVAEDQIDGIDVYKFVQTIPDTKLPDAEAVPGSLVGSSEPSVEADRYYRNVRTLWVEPDSGIIIRGQEDQHQELRVPNSTLPPTVVFNGTLAFNGPTVKANVDRANDAISQLALVATTGPTVLIIGGVVLAIGGVLLLVLPGRRPRGKRSADPRRPKALAGTS